MTNELHHPHDRRFLAWLLLVLGALYALLLGPQWSAGPDTAYYIAIARSIALGHGVEFNGTAVGRAPPGWPLMLAGLMRISSSFVFLGACNVLMLLASTAAWYRIVRRVAAPSRAFWVVLVSGLLYWSYCSTVQLRTEAMFSAVFSGTILLALQLAEGRTAGWRMILVLLGCAAMVFVRFAGLTAVAVVAVASLTRLSQSRRPALFLAVGSILMTVAAFQATRILITDVLPRYIVARPNMGEPIPGISALDSFDRDEGARPVMTSVLGSGKLAVYLGRAASAGQWLAGYFWMPLHAANSNAMAAMAVNLLGWILVAILLVGVWQCIRHAYVLPLGAVLYVGSIVARWSTVNPRYLMPVAPLLILAFWMGLEYLRGRQKSSVGQRACSAAIWLWVGSLVLANMALYAVDLFIARSSRYYHYYNGGELQQLVSVSKFLLDRDIADGEVATNYYIVSTINKVRTNGYAHRGLFMLTDRGIHVVPNNVEAPGITGGKKARGVKRPAASRPATNPAHNELASVIAAIRDGRPDNPAVARFCEMRGIRYYVYRPPGSHAWHFRKSQLPSLLVGGKKIKDAADWELYELIDGKLCRLSFPLLLEWPSRVPGI